MTIRDLEREAQKKAVNKVARLVAGSVVALALVTTGGTYASWRTSVTSSTASVITTAGDTLKIEPIDSAVWTDTTVAGNPEIVPDMTQAHPMMQGNSYRFTQKVRTTTGAMNSNLKVELPWVNTRMLTDMDLTVTLLDENGETMGMSRIMQANLASGTVAFTIPAPTGIEESYVQIDIIFLAGTQNANGGNSNLHIGDVVLTLDQTA